MFAGMIQRAALLSATSWALLGTSVACAPHAARPPPGVSAVASNPSPVEAQAPRVATPRTALLALAKRDQTLAIVDPITFAVVAKVPVGEDPHEVVTTADGTTAYVSNYGSGAFNTLAVVDLVAQRPLPSVDLGALRGPHGLMEQGDKIWFTAEGADVVGSYDPRAGKVDWVFGTGQDRTHMVFVSDDLQRVVTTNVNAGTVSIIDKSSGPPKDHGPPPSGPPPAGLPPSGPPIPGPPGGHGPPRDRWEQTVVSVARGDEGCDVSPDRKEIWVANSQPGTVSIIDYAAKTVIQTLDAQVVGANRLKFTPDGQRVLISSLRGGGLVVYDVHRRTVVERLPLGRGTAGILVQPDGKRAFVACSPDDDVAVIDLETLTVVGHVAVGHEPDGLAWAERK
jgi:YVTN family beta-propeller protein